jgi:hypothetical protein
VQCMVAKGNQVQRPVVYSPPSTTVIYTQPAPPPTVVYAPPPPPPTVIYEQAPPYGYR